MKASTIQCSVRLQVERRFADRAAGDWLERSRLAKHFSSFCRRTGRSLEASEQSCRWRMPTLAIPERWSPGHIPCKRTRCCSLRTLAQDFYAFMH